jgi:RNA polymerase sigma-70 factor (ECF subfamily)
MDHPSQAPGEDLEMYRPYLLCLARQQLDRRLQSKVDLSGVVNQTLYEARQRIADVLGRKEADILRWLRSILAHNMIDETRSFRGPTRDPSREVSIEADLEQSSNRLAACLAAEQTSPSQRVVRSEDVVRLTQAITSLPEDQRAAVECHHLQGMSLVETAEKLGKSKAATAGLLYRGLNALRDELSDSERG